jgi:hypothetical protein
VISVGLDGEAQALLSIDVHLACMVRSRFHVGENDAAEFKGTVSPV